MCIGACSRRYATAATRIDVTGMSSTPSQCLVAPPLAKTIDRCTALAMLTTLHVHANSQIWASGIYKYSCDASPPCAGSAHSDMFLATSLNARRAARITFVIKIAKSSSTTIPALPFAGRLSWKANISNCHTPSYRKESSSELEGL